MWASHLVYVGDQLQNKELKTQERNPIVYQQMKGFLKKCGRYTQWNTMQPLIGESLTDHNTDEPQGHYAERNKPVAKVKILRDPTLMKHPK